MSVDVPVALLGYGTVGSAVARLLADSAEDIERATGHRLRLVHALVRDVDKEREFQPDDGVLTTDFARIRDDESIAVVAEVMGGLEPTGDYLLELLRAGKPVVTANKQLLARRSTELFAAAAEAGVQLRFEASVCAAIPVIKVLRESLVVTNVHRVLGIVNGTTNFILTRMETGAGYDEALAEAQRLGYAEADPTEDVSGADAAAKMAILASVAFGSRVELDDVAYEGIERIRPEHVEAADSLDSVIRLVGTATLVNGAVDVRVGPALVNRHHPLASVEGPFNAVMLHGDAIREIMLEGPGAGGLETASAVVADMVSVLGTTGTGFLQDDACWRSLPTLPAGRPPGAVLRPDRGRGPARRARARRRAVRRRRRLDRPAVAARAERQRRARRRHAHRTVGPRRRCARRDRGPSRGAAPAPRRSGSSASAASDRERHARRRLDAAALPAAPVRTARCRAVGQVGGREPDRSFKDRGMAVAVSRALERGAPGIVCASTGNTAASAAAYAARAGLPAIVVTSRGAVARGKMIQARAAGVEAREIDGAFSDAHLEAQRLAEAEGLVNVNSINPDRIEGQSSAAREVLEQLGGLPDVLALPYGGGGNTVSYASRAFGETLPRFLLGEAAQRHDTFASAIRITEPVHRDEVDRVLERSGGQIVSLSEADLERAWRSLAREEGIFCEPASAAGIAAIEAAGLRDVRVVCVVTGHGLKDTDAV